MGFYVKGDGTLVVEIPAPHKKEWELFQDYDVLRPRHAIEKDYRKVDNIVGYLQRSFLQYWILRGVAESGGVCAVDLGSAGVHHPFCLSTDILGNGEVPSYGGVMQGVQVKADAGRLWMFEDGAFSAVVSNHVCEHIHCSSLPRDATPQERYQFGCPGYEVEQVLREHWIRVTRPGGYLAMVVPDEAAAREGGSTVFAQDPTHQHAWSVSSFYDNVIAGLLDLVDVIQFGQFDNHFSFECVLRKKL